MENINGEEVLDGNELDVDIKLDDNSIKGIKINGTYYNNINYLNEKELFKWKATVLVVLPSCELITGEFTPVCTTEFLAFAKSFKSFQDRNTELLGLSIDGIYSHLAWVNNIYEITGVEIPFPIIADADMSISKLYGLLTPDVSCCETVRATFIIDPNQFIRLILYYPFNIGRNIMEILRCIDALQFSAQEKLATPANWMPGLAGVMPPPKTYEGLKNRERSCGENCKCLDWYLCFKGNNLDVLE